jgi:nucleotide-binding universal stress UspA family protein
MYKRIVVGLDESERAQDALAFGKLIAEVAGASLTIAGVVQFDPRWGERDPSFQEAEAACSEMLKSAAGSVGGDPRIVASTSAARGLHALAEESGADLVVVGSSKHGSHGQIFAGSVAMALLHGSPCSVAIAPIGFAQQAPDAIAEVTLGYDGSEESRLALAEAADLARAADAPLHVVAVAETPPVVYGKGAGGTRVPAELKDAIREMMARELEEVMGLIPAGVAQERTLVEGHAAEALADAAVADGGVLVVGSRAYGPLRRVLLGSVSTPLVRSVPCPLIVHPRPAGEAGSAG